MGLYLEWQLQPPTKLHLARAHDRRVDDHYKVHETTATKYLYKLTTHREVHEALNVFVQRFERSLVGLKVLVSFINQVGVSLRNASVRVIMILCTRTNDVGIYRMVNHSYQH